MPGPLPKDPAIRERRNKSSSRALLPAESEVRPDAPQLPALPGKKKWHAMAQLFWETVWASPMSAEFVHGDELALIRLLVLVDAFWRATKPAYKLAYAREIRMLEREFGLTPLSRRRLEWTVAQAKEATDQHEQKRAKRAPLLDGGSDPRKVLDE